MLQNNSSKSRNKILKLWDRQFFIFVFVKPHLKSNFRLTCWRWSVFWFIRSLLSKPRWRVIDAILWYFHIWTTVKTNEILSIDINILVASASNISRISTYNFFYFDIFNWGRTSEGEYLNIDKHSLVYFSIFLWLKQYLWNRYFCFDTFVCYVKDELKSI